LPGRAKNLDTFVAQLAKVPLRFEPGEKWLYSVSTDVLGKLVEVWSGKSLDVFLAERIFNPLDMRDTGFHVPKDKLPRFTANYGSDGKGGLR
ncbi:MAG: serine hydrolase domain-containing protein, partial [Opitutae bacterium]